MRIFLSTRKKIIQNVIHINFYENFLTDDFIFKFLYNNNADDVFNNFPDAAKLKKKKNLLNL